MKLKITRARLAFPNLFEPREQINKEMKFDANFILSPADKAAAQAVVKAVAAEKFGARSEQILAAIERGRNCLRDGNLNLDKSGDVRDGFKDAFFLVAKNKARPLVIGRNKEVLTQKDGKVYGGCYVNATVDIFATTGQKQGGNGIFATLKGVQFVEDGDAFGGGAPADPDEFEDLGVGQAEPALA